MQTRTLKKATALFAWVNRATADRSRRCASAVGATAGLLLAASVLSGCAPLSASAPADPQQQAVAEQRNANALYSQKVLAYKPMFENPGGYGRAQILDAYEAVLQQYSAAAIVYARIIYPDARQTLPPSLQPLPARRGHAGGRQSRLRTCTRHERCVVGNGYGGELWPAVEIADTEIQRPGADHAAFAAVSAAAGCSRSEVRAARDDDEESGRCAEGGSGTRARRDRATVCGAGCVAGLTPHGAV